MTIRVLPDGADGYHLLAPNDDAIVGWVRGQAIGVSGFQSDVAAATSAVRCYPVLASWLERQHLAPLPLFGDEAPQVVHDGAHRWILIGRVLVARLRAEPSQEDGALTHAFEIVLRRELSEGMAIHAALVAVRSAHGTIGAADIAWAPRRRGERRSLPTPFTHLELDA